MKESTVKNEKIPSIFVEGAGSPFYDRLRKYKPKHSDDWESPERKVENFILEFQNACKSGIGSFRVPVYDPSLDGNCKLQFVSGMEPLTGWSYKKYEKMAKDNNLALGTYEQWFLFLGTIILRMVDIDGWTLGRAIKAVAYDSSRLADYSSEKKERKQAMKTGSHEVVGKFDLGNLYKILNREESNRYLLAGGVYYCTGKQTPLGFTEYNDDYELLCNDCTPWFVIPQ